MKQMSEFTAAKTGQLLSRDERIIHDDELNQGEIRLEQGDIAKTCGFCRSLLPHCPAKPR